MFGGAPHDLGRENHSSAKRNHEADGQDIRHLEKLSAYLERSGISRDNVCLVGSSVLADYGLRDNRDLDIAIDPFERGSINHHNTPDEIEMAVEKYSWMGVTDRDLIQDDRYHYWSHGFKIVKPEIELSFKHRRLWEKDQKDIELLEDRFLDADDYDWDWSLFSYEFYPTRIGRRGLPVPVLANSRQSNRSLVARFACVVCDEGLTAAFRSMLAFIGRAVPGSGRFEQLNDGDSRPATTTDQTLYFVAWPIASEFFNPITSRFDVELGVVSTETIELDDSLEQFIHDIYDYDDDERLIEYKSYKITSTGHTVKIIETECPVTDSGEFNEEYVSSVKDRIRDQYYPYVPNDSFHNIVHGPDSWAENQWIVRVLSQYIDTIGKR